MPVIRTGSGPLPPGAPASQPDAANPSPQVPAGSVPLTARAPDGRATAALVPPRQPFKPPPSVPAHTTAPDAASQPEAQAPPNGAPPNEERALLEPMMQNFAQQSLTEFGDTMKKFVEGEKDEDDEDDDDD